MLQACRIILTDSHSLTVLPTSLAKTIRFFDYAPVSFLIFPLTPSHFFLYHLNVLFQPSFLSHLCSIHFPCGFTFFKPYYTFHNLPDVKLYIFHHFEFLDPQNLKPIQQTTQLHNLTINHSNT